MADDQLHEVRVRLTREQAPIRKAHLEMTGTDVTFGVPGWQGEHYGFAPGSVPEYPGTLDYLVASVAGCLIGTFGGTLKARGITATGDDLVADAIGEVGVDEPIHDLPLGKVFILVDSVESDESEKIGGNREPASVAKSWGSGVGGQRSELATELPIKLRLEFLQSLRVE